MAQTMYAISHNKSILDRSKTFSDPSDIVNATQIVLDPVLVRQNDYNFKQKKRTAVRATEAIKTIDLKSRLKELEERSCRTIAASQYKTKSNRTSPRCALKATSRTILNQSVDSFQNGPIRASQRQSYKRPFQNQASALKFDASELMLLA